MTEVPASFGKYYLTEKLAAGGMAEIYLGKLVGPGGFEKLLVIKQIHPRFGGLRRFVDLFVAEAKILVGLVHGNIVPVYELGVIGDTYFIAMEYIDGPSLYRLTEELRVHGESMAPALAAHIATKVLDGLDYAHRKGDGVIHRDLSGRNVMLSRDGEVKLVDFGIAVALGDAGDTEGEIPAGSFPYMSPEQVRCEPLTGQSDLFSVGILLWEMLTGQRLFMRAEADATLRAVTDAPIAAPSTHNPAVPGRLDDVVMKALQRDRDQRWHSAAEMLAALHRYLYSLEVTPGPRELGILVARRCPPTKRRHHTESDGTAPVSAVAAGEEETLPSAATKVPSTALLARPTLTPALRQQSFATHVELADLLQSKSDAASQSTAARLPQRHQPDPAAVEELGQPPPTARHAAAPGAWRWWRIAAMCGSLAAMAGTAFVAWPTASQRGVPTAAIDPSQAPAPVRARDAGSDAGGLGKTAALDAAPPSTGSQLHLADASSGTDAAVRTSDAATARLVRPSSHRDASVRDASTAAPADRTRRQDASGTVAVPRTSATAIENAIEKATIKVGANPWGEVALDGKPVGRTPMTLTVVPGHHEIEVRFPVGDSPRRETYRLDLSSGETRSVLADFTQ